MTHMDPVKPPTDEESALASDGTGYRYTDPVADEAFPRVIEATDDLLDEFAEGWGDEPTWRAGRPSMPGTGERDGRSS